jgi:hypothetical protein
MAPVQSGQACQTNPSGAGYYIPDKLGLGVGGLRRCDRGYAKGPEGIAAPPALVSDAGAPWRSPAEDVEDKRCLVLSQELLPLHRGSAVQAYVLFIGYLVALYPADIRARLLH